MFKKISVMTFHDVLTFLNNTNNKIDKAQCKKGYY